MTRKGQGTHCLQTQKPFFVLFTRLPRVSTPARAAHHTPGTRALGPAPSPSCQPGAAHRKAASQPTPSPRVAALRGGEGRPARSGRPMGAADVSGPGGGGVATAAAAERGWVGRWRSGRAMEGLEGEGQRRGAARKVPAFRRGSGNRSGWAALRLRGAAGASGRRRRQRELRAGRRLPLVRSPRGLSASPRRSAGERRRARFGGRRAEGRGCGSGRAGGAGGRGRALSPAPLRCRSPAGGLGGSAARLALGGRCRGEAVPASLLLLTKDEVMVQP